MCPRVEVATIGIVGSTGFIGSYLFRYLLSRQQERIRLLVRRSTCFDDDARADVIHGDLLSPVDCERFADGAQVIYYLAHVNSPVDSDSDAAHDTAVNLVPLLNLLQTIARLKSRPHIVYFSSGGAIYDPALETAAYRETDPCAPRSSYGIQKLAAEHYLRLAAERGDLTATVLRVGNAYGTLLPEYRMQGLIGVALNTVLHGRPVRVFGDVENVRDYVHLEDVCEFAAWAAVPRIPFDVFNVGCGIGHSVADVLRLIEECYGDPIQVIKDTSVGSGLVGRVVLDISKARREGGWIPRISLRAGIRQIIAERRREIALGVSTA